MITTKKDKGLFKNYNVIMFICDVMMFIYDVFNILTSEQFCILTSIEDP